jgi:hypothetical protein
VSVSDDEMAEAQRRYYEGLRNAPPGTLSSTQYGNVTPEPSWEKLWRMQRELSDENRADARRYRGWAWLWFICAATQLVGHLVWG